MTVQCSWCRRVKIGDFWVRMTKRLRGSHGICPECRARVEEGLKGSADGGM